MALSKKLFSYLRINKRLSRHMNTKKCTCKKTKIYTDAKRIVSKTGCVNCQALVHRVATRIIIYSFTK